jgi:hypothetical protein
MLDSSRREVLVSAVINTVPDFATGAAVAVVARLTGIEALELEEAVADETAADGTAADETATEEPAGDETPTGE